MIYAKEEIEKAVKTLENPSSHIKIVREYETEHFAYSADLVKALEIATGVLNEKLDRASVFTGGKK